MSKNTVVKSMKEEDWMADRDAEILEEYNAIVNDKKRLDKALKAAAKKVENLSERAEALDKTITGIKTHKK